jgi:DNA-binding IclR family transcriptional regulator
MPPVGHNTTNRILDALEVIARQENGISLANLAREIGAPKGSLYPLLATLAQRRYLSYNHSERHYSIGPGLFVLGRSYINRNDLLESIDKEIHNLASQVEETVYFGVLDGGDMLYLAMSDAFTKIKVISSPGRKLPAYSTGCGKAMLSQFSMAQLRKLYPKGLRKVTERTVTSFELLVQQLEQVRRTGFAFEEEESTPYIRCVGIPIYNDNRIVAGLSVAVPILRYDADKEEKIKALLLETKIVIEAIIQRGASMWTYS